MASKNPKRHDALFKWLIAAFTEDFFAHYFPQVNIGKYEFIDKEFFQRYEDLRESMQSDLFLAMQVEVDGEWRQVIIIIEHKSKREDIGEQVMDYFCYGWLLKHLPIWSIGVFTDDAVWRKRISDQHWYAFHSRKGRLHHYYDVVKIKDEKSSDLIKKRSLMCKLLALKANDKNIDRMELIREIYQTVEELKDQLDDAKLVLLERWIDTYGKISEEIHKEIKKEFGMTHVATTITEQILHEGEEKGRIEGEIKGEIKGRIKTLEALYEEGLLSTEEFEKRITPLRQKLVELLKAPTNFNRS